MVDSRIEYYRERICNRLAEVSDIIGEAKYLLYCSTVNECEDFSTLRDMAELDMQIEFIAYVEEQINSKLNKFGYSISDIHKTFNGFAGIMSEDVEVSEDDNLGILINLGEADEERDLAIRQELLRREQLYGGMDGERIEGCRIGQEVNVELEEAEEELAYQQALDDALGDYGEASDEEDEEDDDTYDFGIEEEYDADELIEEDAEEDAEDYSNDGDEEDRYEEIEIQEEYDEEQWEDDDSQEDGYEELSESPELAEQEIEDADEYSSSDEENQEWDEGDEAEGGGVLLDDGSYDLSSIAIEEEEDEDDEDEAQENEDTYDFSSIAIEEEVDESEDEEAEGVDDNPYDLSSVAIEEEYDDEDESEEVEELDNDPYGLSSIAIEEDESEEEEEPEEYEAYSQGGWQGIEEDYDDSEEYDEEEAEGDEGEEGNENDWMNLQEEYDDSEPYEEDEEEPEEDEENDFLSIQEEVEPEEPEEEFNFEDINEAGAGQNVFPNESFKPSSGGGIHEAMASSVGLGSANDTPKSASEIRQSRLNKNKAGTGTEANLFSDKAPNRIFSTMQNLITGRRSGK